MCGLWKLEICCKMQEICIVHLPTGENGHCLTDVEEGRRVKNVAIRDRTRGQEKVSLSYDIQKLGWLRVLS